MLMVEYYVKCLADYLEIGWSLTACLWMELIDLKRKIRKTLTEK